MKELTALRQIAEAQAGASRAQVDAFFNKLESEVEAAYDAIGRIRTTIQSQVLSDMVKALGMPATETKALKMDAESAWAAIRKLESEVNDTYMAVATAADDAASK